jgi:serine/threonine protein phosphatase PrpC
MSTIDVALVQAYLSNMQLALQNLDVPCAELHLDHALELLAQPDAPQSLCLPMQIDVGVSLDAGIRRKSRPNEDAVFAATGRIAQTEETYGLFVVADGMGGHARGQDASRLVTQTLVDTLFPLIQRGHVQGTAAGSALVDAVTQANAAVYEQNQQTTSLLDQMGTTVTAVLVVGPHAFIANVGDSRTYLYRPGAGLRVLTRDHSVVSQLVADGVITPEEVYTHPERNKILRCLGAAPTVEVDLFYEQLQDGDIVLCCSDGVWEMTRDPEIEKILSSSWLQASHMAERLMHAALQGGGLDNIGLVVAQFQMDVPAMQTIIDTLSSLAAAAS